MVRGFRAWPHESRGKTPAADDRAGAKPAAKVLALALWRAAARSATDPPGGKPRPRKRTRSGGDSKSARPLTVSGIVADYLALCRNPLQDLQRWIAEDKKRPGGPRRVFQPPTNREGKDVADTTKTGLANAHGIRGHPLPKLRGGLDTHRKRGRGSDRVLARSRARFGRYDRLRSLRGEEAAGAGGGVTAPRSGGDAGADLSFRGARAAVAALYAAKIEATRRSLPPREIAAALRALVEERRAAMRAIDEHHRAAQAAAHERRDAERFTAKLARQRARAEARPS